MPLLCLKSTCLDLDQDALCTVHIHFCLPTISTCLVCPLALHKNSGLFSSRCDGAWAVEGYRVGQVTTILSNLVLISKFVPYLSRQEDILRFLLLASSCSLPEIRGSAMDVLIEIGPYLTVTSSASCPSPPSSPRCHSPRSNNYPVQLLEGQRSLELLIRSLFESLASPDRAAVVKSEWMGVATNDRGHCY